MTERIRIQIVGATGYAGGDLLHLLLRHPHVEIVSLIAADVDTATDVGVIWPDLLNVCRVPVEPATGAVPDGVDLAFMATPDKVAMKLTPGYLEKGIKVVDFAADYRFKNVQLHDEIYGGEHGSPDLCSEAVYGLPELYRAQIAQARLVGNPGCYSTCGILGLYPAIKEGIIEPTGSVVSASSGVTGAGKHPSLAFHHPEVAENYRAYKVASHRHGPEIEDILGRMIEKEVRLTFVPHLLPIRRGILATIYGERATSIDLKEIYSVYRDVYAGEPFIRVLPLDSTPQLQAVQLSNFCDISVHEDRRNGKIIILSALDNTGKGASSQAVQNLNVMAGFDEKTGLWPTSL